MKVLMIIMGILLIFTLRCVDMLLSRIIRLEESVALHQTHIEYLYDVNERLVQDLKKWLVR